MYLANNPLLIGAVTRHDFLYPSVKYRPFRLDSSGRKPRHAVPFASRQGAKCTACRVSLFS